MLEFSQSQLDQLDSLAKQRYVEEVRLGVVRDHPELNGPVYADRIRSAYRQVLQLGFSDGAAITQFLRYEAIAPYFYRDPAVNAWLRRAGQPVEQRFSDLVQAMRTQTRDL